MAQQAMGAIHFGTDGWRAIIAEDFTFTNLDRVAQATADYWRANPVPGVHGNRAVVGYDRRFLSQNLQPEWPRYWPVMASLSH